MNDQKKQTMPNMDNNEFSTKKKTYTTSSGRTITENELQRMVKETLENYETEYD